MKRSRKSQRQVQKVKTKITLSHVKAGMAIGGVIFIIFLLYNNFGTAVFNKTKASSGADCLEGASGDETSYGSDSWIGYLYSQRNDFSTANYQGFITEPDVFDEAFCGNNCDFSTAGCDVNTQTFSVRFKMRKNFSCGAYRLTVGGDDGIRLSIDGGVTYIINGYVDQVFTTYSTVVGLDGDYDLVLEYYENGGENRVSFNYTNLGATFEGEIESDQTVCSQGSVDPETLTSVSSALICGSAFTYQWQQSSDSLNFTNIDGATSEVYDPPADLSATTYYRRGATDGGTQLYSNVVQVIVGEPQGIETTYGDSEWIGYVYDGIDAFQTANYKGFVTETEIFDESFCGNNCDFTTNGCNVETETFSVRFKMQKIFTCGVYELAVGADDGVRLSIDGGVSYIIDSYFNQAYTSYNTTVPLDGTYNMVLEYFENGGSNRVTFEYARIGDTYPGDIDGEQSFCASNAIDPDILGNVNQAIICGSSVSYQWQSSTDNVNFTDISGANTSTYDPPAGVTANTYYRRQAIGGGHTLNSNTVSVAVNIAQGDEVSYGDESWIGYFYDQADNFESADYMGFDTENEEFDQNFGGNHSTFPINGCDVYTDTFSVRYRMRKTFVCGNYTLTIGGDDGVRLSLDGGATYIINDYSRHGYRLRSTDPMELNGTYDMVLDYYEATGGNRVSFEYVENAGCVLPIELLYFRSKNDEETGGVRLEWKSATEENNDYYTLLRGSSPDNLEELARVAGAGNSFAPLEYDYVDAYPLPGRSYYRLKQTDYDGDFEVFDLVTVDNNDPTKSLEILSASPNPFNDRFEINFIANQGEVSLDMVGIDGNLIHQESIQVSHGQNQYLFERGYDLPKGIYIVRLQQVGHSPQMVKLMKR